MVIDGGSAKYCNNELFVFPHGLILAFLYFDT